MAQLINQQFNGLTFCICGGGSLAHAVATVLSASPLNKVLILSRHAAQWSEKLVLNYRNEASMIGHPALISDDPAAVIPQADIIFIIVPHAFREEVLKSIAAFVQQHAWVGALPGFAGFAWTARHHLGPGIRLFGSQRVPYVCHKEVYGQQVHVTGIRPRNYIAALPAEEVNEIAEVLRKAMNLYVVPVSNYMNICFSRSNSVFHPARLYGLCQHWDGTDTPLFNEPQKFYGDWDDRSSQIFFELDAEMQAAAAAMPLDLLWAQPVLQHYEIAFRSDLTNRIRLIEALADRPFPMVPVNGGFIPDIRSYYFTEDIVYGLTTLKAIFELAGTASPVTDTILKWAQKILGTCWINEDGCLHHSSNLLPWPQRFGIKTLKQLTSFSVNGKLC